MATNCSDGIYTIHYTDTSKNPITVNKKTINQGIVDLTFFGKSRKEYGEEFDENLLHLLENFAAVEDADAPGNPDLTQTFGGLLANPSVGQKWYNKTQKNIYVYDGVHWNPLGAIGDVAGNSGIIAHGQQLPLPVSPITGYQFSYPECAWIVSMYNFPDQVDNAICTTNSSGLVTSQYTVHGTTTPISGYAFYQILGIRALAQGVLPTPTPTPTPSLTPSITITNSVTPTITPTVTRTRTPIASATPSVTPSMSRSANPSPTPVASPTSTPGPSPTPAPSPSMIPQTLPFNGQTYRRTCSIPMSGSGNLGVNIQIGTGYWNIQSDCHGNTVTLASGTLPSNAYSIQYVTTYRPDLAGGGGTNDPGTAINTATSPSVISASTYYAGVTTRSVNGNTSADYESCYTVQVLIRDVAGQVIMSSTCTMDAEVLGSA